jgi:class 3 adenylate cyclase
MPSSPPIDPPKSDAAPLQELGHGPEVRWDAVLDRRRLEFLEPDYESSFRAAERERNINQARFGLGLALALNLLYGAMDPLVYAREYLLWISLTRVVAMTALLALFIGLTYLPFFRTRWPMLLVWAEFVFAIGYGLVNVIGDAPLAIVTSFIIVVLGCYLLLPLIFQYGVRAACLASLTYLLIVGFGMDLSWLGLSMTAMQLVTANIIGILALYRSERHRRLDFLRNLQVAEERARYRQLLTNILPESVADRLERGETVADEFDEATVLFCDIVGFTQMAARWPAGQVLDLLNRVFARFDELVDRYGLEKVKTIGDAYMAAGGVPQPRADHVAAMADLALAMLAAGKEFRDPDGEPLRLRIGIHSGALVAGIIGERRFTYDVWGDTVNTASRMESLGAVDSIQVSRPVYDALKDRFTLVMRGEIEVRGKGRMPTWYLTGRRAQ